MAGKRAKGSSDVVLDELTFEEVQAIKTELASGRPAASGAGFGPELMLGGAGSFRASGPALVAEGDSWFDYPPGLDILDNLRRDHGYVIHSLAAAGDTLENMAFGTQIRRDFSRLPAPVDALARLVERVRPRVVLLSAGGNDVAGEGLDAYLNHADTGLPPLRLDYLRGQLEGPFSAAYRRLAGAIWEVDRTITIVTHGYDYAVPNGSAVLNFPWDYRFIGPWLKPSFARKNINETKARATVRGIIDEFNGMLAKLSEELGERFQYIDLRGVARSNEWVNELHLTSEAYRRVAGKFHERIQGVM